MWSPHGSVKNEGIYEELALNYFKFELGKKYNYIIVFHFYIF